MPEHWTIAAAPDLAGTVAVVTGANAGLGLEITHGLAGRGARVLMACRNAEKAERAAAEVRARTPGAEVEVVPLDLASLASVRALGADLREREHHLDLLIHNAGLMAIDEARTEDGFEMQFGVNHLGHFALTAELLPLASAAPAARIVSMSSMGHRSGRMHFDDLMFERRYQRWQVYFQSKLANLLFTLELHQQLRAAGSTVQALAAHPGGSKSDLGHEGTGITNRMLAPIDVFAQSAEAGAQPLLRAATDPEARGGEYYGPRFLVMGHAVRETPSRRARNTDDARRLWRRSEELTGMTIPVS